MTSDADAAAEREARRRARAARRGSRSATATDGPQEQAPVGEAPYDEVPQDEVEVEVADGVTDGEVADDVTDDEDDVASTPPQAVQPDVAPDAPAADEHDHADDPDADQAADDAAAGPRRRRGLRRRSAGQPRPARTPPPWSVVIIACVFAVLGLVVAGVALRQGADADRRQEALEAARDQTVSLTSYDYRRLDEDFERVLAAATGDFAREYRETTEELRPAFTEQQATAVGRVVGAGIEELEDDRAVAVVVVDQVISTAGAEERTERNQLRMALVRQDDRWLVTRVERL